MLGLSSSDYGFGSRLLHRLALGAPFISRASLELESLQAPRVPMEAGPPLYITGLARAGTTILLRAIYDTEQFRSLTYRDMPFVLMPNLWKRFSQYSRREMKPKERAHGDRIEVTPDSPEAFEEVFWRAHCGKKYILPNCLKPHDVSDEILQLYQRYVQLVVQSSNASGLRYLAKNNNQILRLKSIRAAFPDAIILVPFRDPFQQAHSLHSQHLRFCRRHADHPFELSYMNWLGHYEFGQGYKPFRPGENESLATDPEDINHWLQVWIVTYRYLIELAGCDLHFVSYEDLCKKTASTLNHVFKIAEIQGQSEKYADQIVAPLPKSGVGFESKVRKKALEIYQVLQEKAIY